MAHANHRHSYAPFCQRAQRLRLSRVAALFALKAIDTRPEVLAGLKLRSLEKRGKNKGKPVFSHQDALEVNQLEIARLEEDYAEVVKELEDFEALKDGV